MDLRWHIKKIKPTAAGVTIHAIREATNVDCALIYSHDCASVCHTFHLDLPMSKFKHA